MRSSPLRAYSWTLLVLMVLCLVQYFLTVQETAGVWFWPSSMPETFSPRQIVAEIWCVFWFLMVAITGTGAGICQALDDTLRNSHASQ